MYMWVQYEKSTAAWIQRIRNKSIQAPGIPTFLITHHPPTLESSTSPTKTFSHKKCTQLDSLPLELLHNIDMRHAGIVNHKKLKPVLVQLTQKHPVLFEYTSYKLKYNPFDYLPHYERIQYVGAFRRLGPHKSEQKWGNIEWSNMSPSTITWKFKTGKPSKSLTCILNKIYYTNLHNYTSKSLSMSIL